MSLIRSNYRRNIRLNAVNRATAVANLQLDKMLAKRGANIKAFMAVKGYTAAYVAARVFPNVHPNAVYAWQKTGKISANFLEQLIAMGLPSEQAYIGLAS